MVEKYQEAFKRAIKTKHVDDIAEWKRLEDEYVIWLQNKGKTISNISTHRLVDRLARIEELE